MQHSKILILDFGSQVTQLIARRVREAHVYCEIHPCDVSDDWVRAYAQRWLAQGHHPLRQPRQRLRGDHRLRAPQAVFELGVPVLGICYGMQTMAEQLGGKVEGGRHTANSATPRCAPTATPRCSTASRTSPRPKATACSRSG